jgi:hypothetical protein
MVEVFQKLEKQFDEKFIQNYKGETDPELVLDMSPLKDDLDGLIEEMTKQPSVAAYWGNLRRLAEDNFKKYAEKFEVYQASKTVRIVEELKSKGIRTPTTKAIDLEFHQQYKDLKLYRSLKTKLDRWRKRRDILIVIEKGVASRDNQLKALSYLMGQMINANIEFPKQRVKPQRVKHKTIKE